MKHTIYDGFFGLERETLRVDKNSRLAQSPHPFGDDENITRDFCENQIELITPVCSSIDEVMDKLSQLDKEVRDELSKNGERIWLYSNPPYFKSEDEIPVADFRGEHSGKRIYREQLQRRYGKRLMLFSGIHFNFSFYDEYLKSISDCTDFRTFKNGFYMRLYKQLSIHSWLPLLLTASSHICERSLYKDGDSGVIATPYASIRSGKEGYWNEFVPVLDHTDIDSFIASIQSYVDKGALFSASELYLPVRLKPVGVNSLDSFKNGISHIELRMFDINPFTPLGIDERDLRFTHLLIMYLSQKEDFDYTEDMQRRALAEHQSAALYDLSEVMIGNTPIIEKAKEIISSMRAFFAKDENAQKVLDHAESRLDNRLCEKEINIY